MRKPLFLFILFILPAFAVSTIITHLKIEGAISPASCIYLKDGLEDAKIQNSQIILIELDTPGGLAASMRDMIKEITNSPIPIVVYVSPKGAHAASAGTYLLYAAHIAAMAPGTNIGAATPISMIQPPKSDDSNKSVTSALEKKVLSDSMAYIKSLAQLRDRNASWALQAVGEAKSLSAKDALKYGVIEIIAEDLNDLVTQLNGMDVMMTDKKKITLNTENATISYFEPDWKTEFLMIITNPNIAYMLMLMAIYGIFFELMNPGSIFPGVIGAICGVMALYALNILPFNYAGLLLMILGIVFMIAEVFVAGFGILGIGGAIAFAAGSMLLFDAKTLGDDISIPLILAFSLVSLAFFILVLKLVISSRSTKVVTGRQEMIGATAYIIKSTEKGYLARCHGEVWEAVSSKPLMPDQKAVVESISGLTLHLKPLKE